jgi:hypothetical protein
MSTFVEVHSNEKNCSVIINLEHVVEIAPLVKGGCVIVMIPVDAGVSKTMTVKNDYSEFKQFALQTVSAEDIKKRIEALNPEKRGPGRPPKTEVPEPTPIAQL